MSTLLHGSFVLHLAQVQQAVPAPSPATMPVQQIPVQAAEAQRMQVQNPEFVSQLATIPVPQFYSQEEVIDNKLLQFGSTM